MLVVLYENYMTYSVPNNILDTQYTRSNIIKNDNITAKQLTGFSFREVKNRSNVDGSVSAVVQNKARVVVRRSNKSVELVVLFWSYFL